MEICVLPYYNADMHSIEQQYGGGWPVMLNELYELVFSICDSLYIQRQLLTGKAVEKVLSERGIVIDVESSVAIASYIGAWRLQNLVANDCEDCSHVEELDVARKEIGVLRAQLVQQRQDFAREREQIAQDLRALLVKKNG
jgi:hypothetical protein